jgi:integrase
MGTLQHLGGERWRVRVDAGPDPATGKRHRVSKTFTANGQRAADKAARRIETAIEDALAERRQRAGSVGELVKDWLIVKQQDLSPTTLREYKRRSKRIVARFDRTPVTSLTGRDLDQWYAALLEAKVSPAEVHHTHLVLRAVLLFGFERGDTVPPVWRQAHPPKYEPRQVRPPTVGAWRAVLDGLPTGKQWANAVRILALTGMRRGEVVGLRWDSLGPGYVEVRHSIVEVDGQLTARIPKGKRERTVDVDAAVEAVLVEQREFVAGRSPWVFPDLRADPSGATPRRPGWLSTMWTSNRGDFGADGIGLHALRHAYATVAIDAGAPITAVSEQLGHAKTATTLNIYGHRSDQGRSAVVAAIRAATRPELPAPQPPPS